MLIEEILIVKNAHESYGIPIDEVNQISRVPSLMPLPLRPSGVRGLCSVSGSVVSMVDMNLLLGLSEVDIEANSSRIISLNEEYSSNALLVSTVYNTVEVQQDRIEYLDDKDDPVVGIYKYKNTLVQVLSLSRLFSKINKIDIRSKEIHSGKIKNKIAKEEDSQRFLIFSMSREKYALDIDYLQEIILAECDYTQIAGTSSEVLGLITLRDELLMVIDLRVYYGFEAKHSDTNRILVVSCGDKKIALYIDSIIDIKNYNKKDIEYFHNEKSQIRKIAGVIHENESLISFFNHEVIQQILKENDAYIESKDKSTLQENSQVYAMEVIVFRLASKEYAFNIEYVDEIIDMIPSTKIAFTDKFIDGIINIRGQIVTIVSLFDKLHITRSVTEDSKIIICNIDDTRIGFVVDSVSDILSVKEDEIKEEADNYFDNILHLDNGKRLVLSMDVEKILQGKY
ncbi:chemotaxis protein CheW [Sulfurimonas aquatica]|uniref:Chemotaxis protein CheW n=1 Tax=Sulfurimonas aquatica TaxID=2672570 RepID=A0A975GDF1_9BACT|nr:chemotaxis protein CheW [Sulfurimonas aquatica]QSZ42293.1 chemotaxis protein CheW [Sulfurimonas aquatica]